MRDVHCHIVFGVDDGSRSLDESLAMLHAAREAGITQIVCTPHCRGRHFDRERIIGNFQELQRYAGQIDMMLGYEVYVEKLLDMGIEHARDYRLGESDEFLLELPTGLRPTNLDTVVYKLQGQGLQVIIAHPERYAYVQGDLQRAYDLVDMGCKLQVSADFMGAGMFSKHGKCAKALLKEGLINYIASDAHAVDDYADFRAAVRKYGSLAEGMLAE